MVKIDVNALTVAVGVVIPLLVGLCTKYLAHSGLKATVNLTLTLAAGFVTQLINGGGVLTQKMIVTWAVIWVLSVASHYGFWSPTGISNLIGLATKNFGLGKPFLDVNWQEIVKTVDAAAADPEGHRPGDLNQFDFHGTPMIGDDPANTPGA